MPLSMRPGSTQRFELSATLQWRSLDDEWVAYSAATGAMAALDAFNAAVLDSVERGAQSVEDVTASLVQEAGLPDDLGVLTQVALVLDQLAAAGFLNTSAE